MAAQKNKDRGMSYSINESSSFERFEMNRVPNDMAWDHQIGNEWIEKQTKVCIPAAQF
jgi:hypothetical protein